MKRSLAVFGIVFIWILGVIYVPASFSVVATDADLQSSLVAAPPSNRSNVNHELDEADSNIDSDSESDSKVELSPTISRDQVVEDSLPEDGESSASIESEDSAIDAEAAVDVKQQTFSFPEYKLEIIVPQDSFTQSFKAVVKAASAEDISLIKRELTSSTETAAPVDIEAFDISFSNDSGVKVDPVDLISLTFKLDDKIDKVLAVYHVKNGVATKVDHKIDNQQLFITTKDFSTYALVYSVEPAATDTIYLNGQTGSDENSGLSSEQAVLTWSKVKQLALDNEAVKFINITGTTTISGDINLRDSAVVVRRDPLFRSYLFNVQDEATLSDITIDGNREQVKARESLINVERGKTLNIQANVVLKNNEIRPVDDRDKALVPQGGAIQANGATINMSGGSIVNNAATLGGAIDLDSRSTMNMTGGEFIDNHAYNLAYYLNGSSPEFMAGAGGAIVVMNGSTVDLGAGVFKNNRADELGGAISLSNAQWSSGACILKMTGGDFRENSAGATGGAIFIQAGLENNGTPAAYIEGGNFIGNFTTGKGRTNNMFGGGAIYVNGISRGFAGVNWTKGELHLKNAIITNNRAAIYGGGLASCPVSELSIDVNNGAAFYGNQAKAAQDIYLLSSAYLGYHSGEPAYRISERMLGGKPYHWRDDNNLEIPLQRLSGILDYKTREIKWHTNEVPDAETFELAKVIFKENSSATRGGAIGSNGKVFIGLDERTQVGITKNWQVPMGTAIPEKIEVEILRKLEGSEEEPVYVGFDTVIPDENGEWQLQIKNLAKHDDAGNAYVYSLRERPVAGFESKVETKEPGEFLIVNQIAPPPTTTVPTTTVTTTPTTTEPTTIATTSTTTRPTTVATATTLPTSTTAITTTVPTNIEVTTTPANSSTTSATTTSPTTTPVFVTKTTTTPSNGVTVPPSTTTPAQVPRTGEKRTIYVVLTLILLGIVAAVIRYLQRRRLKSEVVSK